MARELAPQQEAEIVTTDDGRKLDERQSAAVLAYVRDGLTGTKLAKAAGYSSQQTAMGFLRSDLGKAGVSAAVRIVLAEAGAIGLGTAIRLAKGAKSEKVRLDAANSLMDRAGITVVDPRAPRPAAAGNGISISISLEGQAKQLGSVIDAEVSDAS